MPEWLDYSHSFVVYAVSGMGYLWGGFVCYLHIRQFANQLTGGRLDRWLAAGYTLHKAAEMESLGRMCELLAGGADINLRDGKGDTPLHKAAFLDSYTSVAFLLQNGADPNLQNKDGDTPLHIACEWGCYPTIEYLMRHGANPDIRNNAGKLAAQLLEGERMEELEPEVLKRHLALLKRGGRAC